MEYNHRGNLIIAQLTNAEVSVCQDDYYKGIVHIKQGTNIVAFYDVERIDALIKALQEAKKHANQ